jgi:ketosteroid isomerase-like protein
VTDVLQQIADERALQELLTRYARGVDRCDLELLRSCYHDDALDDHGWFRGPGHDFAAAVIDKFKGGPLTQHAVSNARFDVRGDVAYGESCAMLRTTNADGEIVIGFGRYIDRLERRHGEWRIADRRVTVEGSPAGLEHVDASLFVSATQDRDDPSYVR